MFVSVPLVLEYESAAKALSGHEIALNVQQIDDVIDYICLVASHQQVNYLWRPFLKDADDDMVLELAFSATCPYIVTFNQRDFAGTGALGIEAILPQRALELIR